MGSKIIYNNLLEMIEGMRKAVPKRGKIYIPPNFLERAKKDFPHVEWEASFGDIIWN